MADRQQVLGLVNDWVAAYNAKDYARLRELFADDLVLEDVGMKLHLEGGQTFVDGIREVAETAIPNRRMTVDSILVDGETAIVQGSWEGTVEVEKWGMPPGTRRRHRSCSVVETRDGRIARFTDYTCPDEPAAPAS